MKAVIFDMDGVIIDSQPIADKLLKKTVAKFGITMKDTDLQRLHGLSFPAFWQYVKNTYHLPEPAEYYSNHFDTEEELRLYQGLVPIPGITQLIEDLKKNGIKLALATSASRYRMQKVLTLFTMENTFDETVTYQDVTHAKPDPEIFIKAADAMHELPRDCIVIEDAVNGLHAATRAHMKCVLYWNKKNKPADSLSATMIINNFNNLNCNVLSSL